MTRPKSFSPALAVALLALVVALGVPSYAAKLITGKDVKNSSLTGQDVKDSSLTGSDVKNGSLTTGDLKAGSFVTKVIPRKRVVATNGADVTAARAAAPQNVLYRKGALTVYGKCFSDTATNKVTYEIYVKSTQNGAILDSRTDSLYGGPLTVDFLNPSTDETDATIEGAAASVNDSVMSSQDNSDFTAMAPDGTTLRGWTAGAAKNGTVAFGNAVYGAGNVCLFSGVVFSN